MYFLDTKLKNNDFKKQLKNNKAFKVDKVNLRF